MSTELLLGAETQNDKAASMRHATAQGPDCRVTGLQKLVQLRMQDSLWKKYKNEEQYLQDVEVLEHLIKRMTYHMEKMGDQQLAFKVLAHTGTVAMELNEFQGRLHSLDVLQLFKEELDTMPLLGPFPSRQTLRNLRKAIGMALDTSLKISEFDDIKELDPLDPDAIEEEPQEAPIWCRRPSAPDTTDDEKSLPGVGEGWTVREFFNKWWSWKTKKNLPEAEVSQVQALCDKVVRKLFSRLEDSTSKFYKYPVCNWFLTVLLDSLYEGHLGLLHFNFNWAFGGNTEGFDADTADPAACRIQLPWSLLGKTVGELQRYKYFDDGAACGMAVDEEAFAHITITLMPTFVLDLTHMKAVLLTQVHQVAQLRSKMLAAVVTGGFVVVQVAAQYFQKQLLDD